MAYDADYPATLAGTAFLPFTIIMAALSRWAGGCSINLVLDCP
jgi:hypothetical protein